MSLVYIFFKVNRSDPKVIIVVRGKANNENRLQAIDQQHTHF